MSHDDVEIRSYEVGDLRVESRGRSPVLRGYAIVFNRLSEKLAFFSERGFREQIAPEAIDRTLAERVDLRALVDHDSARILGRISAGTLRVEKDAHGLAVEIDPPPTTAGEDIVASVRRRDVTGMSFAFHTIKDQWDEATTPPTRTVLDMLVREVSIVTFPAYPATEAAVRSWLAYRQGQSGRPVTVSERMRWAAGRKP